MKKNKIIALSLMSILSIAGLVSCGSSSSSNSQSEASDTTSSNQSNASVTIKGVNTCEVGSSVTLTAETKNDNTREGVSWESSNEEVASITQDGLLTGNGEGTCIITATLISDTTIKDTLTFTVTASSEPSVEIISDKTTTTVNSAITLTADVYNPKNKDLTYQWTTSNGNATISNSSSATCIVTGINVGDEKVSLEVMVGQVALKTSISLYFSEDYSAYTPISTAEELKTYIIEASDRQVSGKFYLDADIDLEGEKVDGYANAIEFSGVLDGRGHKIYNYEIIGVLSDGYYGNGSFISKITKTGIIRNLHLVGTTNQEGVGWGSSILTLNLYGTVSNCLIEYENTYNQGQEGWFPFTGAICGVLQSGAVVTNNVVSVTGDGQGGAMAIAAYPEGTGSSQSFKVDGIYTNQSSAATLGSSWDYGNVISNATHLHTDLVFSQTSLSVYETLSDIVWDLTDNQMPTLKLQ